MFSINIPSLRTWSFTCRFGNPLGFYETWKVTIACPTIITHRGGSTASVSEGAGRPGFALIDLLAQQFNSRDIESGCGQSTIRFVASGN